MGGNFTAMIKTGFSIFFLLCSVSFCASQNRDSLLQIIGQNKINSATEKALIVLGEALADNYPDSAWMYLSRAADLSARTFDLENKLSLQNARVKVLLRKGAHRRALDIVNNFMREADSAKNEKISAHAYAVAGKLYGAVSQNDLSIDFFRQAIDLFKNLKDTSRFSEIYANMSTVYADQELYEKSLEYANRSLAAGTADSALKVQAFTNMHHAYGWLNNAAMEEKYMRLCMELADRYHNNHIKIQTLGNTAHWFAENNKYDSAILFAAKEQVLAEQWERYTEQSEAKAIMAWAYTGKGDFAKAFLHLQQAKSIISGKNNIPPLHNLFLLDIEYDLLKAQGKYEEAMAVKEKWADLDKQIMKKATNARLVFLDNEIKKKETERQMAEKEKKIGRQRFLITALGIGFVALFLSASLFHLYQRKKHQAKSETIKLMEKQQEFVRVKSSLEGQLQERTRISKEMHDELGSSLTSITLLTEVLKKRLDLEKNPEVTKISETSSDMVDKMNEIIWALNTSNDTVESLIAYTRKFAFGFLQQAGILLNFNQPPPGQSHTVEGAVRRNIYLTVKEALNNVVKHSGASRVDITVTYGPELIIAIADNGRGFEPDLVRGTGNGIANMKKRMEDAGGSLFIDCQNGTKILLRCHV
jgi:signal transduction histidine kinase